MSMKSFCANLLALLVLASATACTLSLTNAPASPSGDATQAVLTVMAQFTKPAPTDGPTQTSVVRTISSDETEPPAITATPEAPAAGGDIATATTAASSTPAAAASATPQPAATEKPAPSATASVTPTSPYPTADVRYNLAAPAWKDTFDGAQTWYVYEDSRIRFKAEQGSLVMTSLDDEFEVGWALVPLELSKKFYVEMDVTTQECEERDRYGIILSPNREANQGFMYDFSCDGRYSLWVWDGKKEEYTSLIPWTRNTLIRAGGKQTNRIGIKVVDHQLYLYANGTLLTSIESYAVDIVYMGVFLGPGDNSNVKFFTAKVGELAYWSLPEK